MTIIMKKLFILLLLFTAFELHAATAPVNDKDSLLNEMLVLAMQIDPELAQMEEAQRQRVFKENLDRYLGKNGKYNMLYGHYSAELTGEQVTAPGSPGEFKETGESEKINGFDTYIKPDASVKGKPPLPDIIRKRHSWDIIPRFMNFHKNTSGKGDYTEEEISLLAKLDLVQISRPGTGSTGTLEFNKRLRAKNPDIIILGYLNLSIYHDQFKGKIFQEHPEWFLKHKKTGMYTVQSLKNEAQAGKPIYDLRIPEMREWWINEIGSQLTSPGYDGVLIDACAKVVLRYAPRVNATGSTDEELLSFNRHVNDLLLENIRRNGTKGIILSNALRSVYTDCLKSYVDVYFHGSYLEAIEQRTSELYDVHLTRMIDTCIQIQNEDPQKIMIFQLSAHYPPPPLQENTKYVDARVHLFDDYTSMGDGPLAEKQKEMREVFEYKLAMGLIMASDYSYFAYVGTHAIHEDKSLWSPDYPEFNKRLGPPQGPAKKTGPFSYSREFKYASVVLDISLRRGEITWR